MIKPEFIGAEITKKHKGLLIKVKVVDDPQFYAWYKALGLDVFDNRQPAKVKEIKPKKNAVNPKGND